MTWYLYSCRNQKGHRLCKQAPPSSLLSPWPARCLSSLLLPSLCSPLPCFAFSSPPPFVLGLLLALSFPSCSFLLPDTPPRCLPSGYLADFLLVKLALHFRWSNSIYTGLGGQALWQWTQWGADCFMNLIGAVQSALTYL